MVTVNTTFGNFSETPLLLKIFGDFGNEYEYTENDIFRKKNPPQCPICGRKMVHNGFNSYTKKGMGRMWWKSQVRFLEEGGRVIALSYSALLHFV